jgi:hypothetical protein
MFLGGEGRPCITTEVIAMNMSLLELRHTVESCFLPLQCRCFVSADHELTLEVVDPETGENVIVGGIHVGSLNSSRAIATLVAEVRDELRTAGIRTSQQA